jgi:putative oxidoreductase
MPKEEAARRPGEGWEYVATLAMVGATIALAGPGAASLDNAIGIDETFTGAVGALLVVGALGLAGIQLATFLRPPVAES